MLKGLSSLVFWGFVVFMVWLLFFLPKQIRRAEGSLPGNPLDLLRERSAGGG